jgi:hypothetical protein
MEGVRFVIDEKGRKMAVHIDLAQLTSYGR